MADPIPVAATQAAVLKSAASKAASVDPSLSTQAGAVQQDLAVMADQAKGYTAGINAGVIQAQDNRSAQARRIAIERQQADAARARQAQLDQISAQRQQFDMEAQKREMSVRQSEPDTESAQKVLLHLQSNASPQFQSAFQELLQTGATTPDEVVAVMDNWNKYDDSPYKGIDREAVRKYAREYLSALEGKAVNLRRLATEGSATAGLARSAWQALAATRIPGNPTSV